MRISGTSTRPVSTAPKSNSPTTWSSLAPTKAARFRNLFAPELESELSADLLVLALGRIPDRALAESLADVGLEVHEAGDCLGPRGLEEAILEGHSRVRASDWVALTNDRCRVSSG